jgi:hypothetical protein
MAVGDRTESRLGGPTQLGTSTTTVATVAASRVEVIKQIIVCNTDTVDRAVTLAIGSAATVANRLFSALPIGANDVMVFDGWRNLAGFGGCRQRRQCHGRWVGKRGLI